MTRWDKDKVKVLINETKVWADSHEETGYYWINNNETEEKVPVHYLTTSTVKSLLDDLKQKLLKDDDPFSHPEKLRECPHCHSKEVEIKASEGNACNWPASAYVECNGCGLRSKEYDGADETDVDGAVLRATVAWNRRL